MYLSTGMLAIIIIGAFILGIITPIIFIRRVRSRRDNKMYASQDENGQ